MKIYHGTSAIHAKTILESGIVPRMLREGNWKHSVDSNPEHVYLTSVYAGYFASQAAKENDKWLILEVDTDKLDQDSLYPDEDFLEQIERYLQEKSHTGIKIPKHLKSINDRTTWCRQNLEQHKYLWNSSLKILGNCSYKGIIPSDAITAAIEFDSSSNQFVAFACLDPSISIENFMFVGSKYQAITNWFFSENVNARDIVIAADFDKEIFEKQSEFLKDRKGLVRLK